MTAQQKDGEVGRKIYSRTGVMLDVDAMRTLRRASTTLQRWHELECGDGNNYGSWAIERDDNGDGPPYMVHHHYLHGRGQDYITRTRIPDRENGAIRRVKAVCDTYGLFFYIQTDPRGCALYVSTEPLDMTNYTNGTAICA